MPHDIEHRPPLQTRKRAAPHPSAGGRGDGYSQDMRDLVIAVNNAGVSNHPIFDQLRALRVFPSTNTERRHVALQNTEGHIRPCRRTGNNRASALRDHDLLLLALYRITYPKATSAEINAFLYRANYGSLTFRFYSPSQISETETWIGLTRKKGSTTAYQALLPINKLKRWAFWNLPFPYGIADIRRQDMIDLDECGVEVQSADRHWGKSYVGKRVKQTGPYQKSTKYNLLLAISGDGANPRRWRDTWTGEGTTGLRMIEFIRRILNEIGPGTPQRRYCFMMDNLRYVVMCVCVSTALISHPILSSHISCICSSHHNAQMVALIYAAGHRLVFRAPYYPVDGPIEYVFNTIQGILRIRMDAINDGPSLLNELYLAIASIPSFEPYFVNCGFWRN